MILSAPSSLAFVPHTFTNLVPSPTNQPCISLNGATTTKSYQSESTIMYMNRGGGGGQSYGRGGRGRGGRGRGRGGRGGGRGRGRGRGRHQHQNNRNNRENPVEAAHNIGTTGTPSSNSFTVAVQGCSHGELDSIYDALEAYRAQKLTSTGPNSPPKNVDVLLCCGDVQTLRNTADFPSLNVPPKYKAMGDFHAYYSGQKVAPILTIMIGGNHEASNYLQELHYGGWVAPNIYYLGAAGVINICKRTTSNDGTSDDRISTLRIAGLSGIYNSRHYTIGRYEMPPYDQGSLRSVYHAREVDMKRLKAIANTKVAPEQQQQQAIDIMISHDWPTGIARHGNLQQLLRKKPYFKQEIEDNELGSPANEALLHSLKPRYWFAAHLHVKFEATVSHGSKTPQNNTNKGPPGAEGKTEESAGSASSATTEFHGMESNDGICPNNENVETLTEQMTRFLSLDKCLPKRRHIQITHVEPSSTRAIDDSVLVPAAGENCNNAWLEYDATWLAMLRRTHGWTQCTRGRVAVAEDEAQITKEDLDDVMKRFSGGINNGSSKTNLAVPQNFAVTAPPHDPSSGNRFYGPPPTMIGNPQTDYLLQTLGLDHRITVPYTSMAQQQQQPFFMQQPPQLAPQQLIPSAVLHNTRASNMPSHSIDDDNEIDLDDDQEGEGHDDASSQLQQVSGKNDGVTRTGNTHDPEEIDLDELEDEDGQITKDPGEIDLEELEDEEGSASKDDAGGDTVCFSPASNIAKKPRTDT